MCSYIVELNDIINARRNVLIKSAPLNMRFLSRASFEMTGGSIPSFRQASNIVELNANQREEKSVDKVCTIKYEISQSYLLRNDGWFDSVISTSE